MANLPCYFCGYLTGEELARVYASADLFVFPSATDTFGNVVLEAQASGLPVVVIDKGGPCENMIPEKTGVVAPAEDAEGLLAALESMLGNIPRLREMSRAARKYAQQRSFEAAFLKTWRMYRAKTPAPSLPVSLYKAHSNR
jgi:glycosyltransferase involved in cell wall biosynthesis